MKSPGRYFSRRANAGFTLLEMIGVLAIMAILASVLVPNMLRSIDAAASRAESETMRNLSAALEGYLKKNEVLPVTENPAIAPPAVPLWAAQLGDFSSLSPADIAFNRRGLRRVYLVDPALPTRRVIILSALDNNIVPALPRQSDINSVGRFEDIWATADGLVPPTTSWAGWTAWHARANGGAFLVIQRVNLVPIYNTDLQDLTVTLNNKTPIESTPPTSPVTIVVAATTASYGIKFVSGAPPQARQPLPAATSIVLSLRPGDQIDLYRDTVSTAPESSYVVGTGKTFDFTGTGWIPQ